MVLLNGATLVSLDPPAVASGDLRIEGDRIVERGAALTPRGQEEVVELEGRVVMPGLVNAHTHLYSALARGMPPPRRAPADFVDLLRKVWWRLDRALDAEGVYASGVVGAAEAALSGTTLLVDHHSSPGCIEGSLLTLRRAVERVGIRSVLCYEVTDRNGNEARDAGLAENVAFLADHQTALTRGMVGAHASFTLSEHSLTKLADAVARTGSSLHIHVAEDVADVEDSRSRYGSGPAERLRRHGLLMSRAVLAHGVHLTPEEVEQVHSLGTWIAHNPRSNMNNAVGYAPIVSMRRAALGTDGMDQDMFAEARAAFLQMREAGCADAAQLTLQLLTGGHRLAAALFGRPFGKLAAGGPADLVVLDYAAPTPLTEDNVAGHLLFGMDRSHVRSVMVAGRWVVRDRRLVGLDVAAAYAEARGIAEEIWKRMRRLRVAPAASASGLRGKTRD